MTRRAIIVLALVCGLLMSTSARAGAASGGTPAQAITDCNDHGQLTQQYSTDVLRQALAQMPSDVREYTDCYDVIQRQLLKQVGSTNPGAATTTTSSSGGGSVLPTWLIVVIIVLALAAITFGALAIRRRGGPPEGPDGPGGGPGGPGAPAGPGGPVEPGGPDAPAGPGGPVEPGGPDAPTQRMGPDAPTEPGPGPDRPGGPPAT
jgi:hypothetical protein